MKYDKSEATLSVEIPTYTVELKSYELFTLLTYIARRNPDVVNLLGTSDYPIEKILQNYFQCMYWEDIGWKEKEYCMEQNQMRRAKTDTEKARVVYEQLKKRLEKELGEPVETEGYYGVDVGSDTDLEVEERHERLEKAWGQVQQSLEVIKEEIGELQGLEFEPK